VQAVAGFEIKGARKRKESPAYSNLYLGENMKYDVKGRIPTISLRNSKSVTPTKEFFDGGLGRIHSVLV
jgi:uncharacterized protein YuzE